MKKLMLFESFISILQENKKDKKDEKWIQKVIKKPGALHKSLGIPNGETIPMTTIDSKIEALHNKKEKDGELDKKESKLLRRLNLAKTLKTNIG